MPLSSPIVERTLGMRHASLIIAVVAIVGLLAPGTTPAADAHRAVQPKPGEIVVVRNVGTRPAYRPAPPGQALIANPSPQHELDAALGTGELSEADYAGLDASNAPRAQHTTVERLVGQTLGSSLGAGPGARNGTRANGISSVMAAPMGAITQSGRGIGSQVQGALSQLPGMTAPNGAGH